MINNKWNYRSGFRTTDVTITHLNHFFSLELCRLREIKNAQFFGNFLFQCFELDIRNQDTTIFWICTDIVDASELATILSLFLALAGEICLRVHSALEEKRRAIA